MWPERTHTSYFKMTLPMYTAVWILICLHKTITLQTHSDCLRLRKSKKKICILPSLSLLYWEQHCPQNWSVWKGNFLPCLIFLTSFLISVARGMFCFDMHCKHMHAFFLLSNHRPKQEELKDSWWEAFEYNKQQMSLETGLDCLTLVSSKALSIWQLIMKSTWQGPRESSRGGTFWITLFFSATKCKRLCSSLWEWQKCPEVWEGLHI